MTDLLDSAFNLFSYFLTQGQDRSAAVQALSPLAAAALALALKHAAAAGVLPQLVTVFRLKPLSEITSGLPFSVAAPGPSAATTSEPLPISTALHLDDKSLEALHVLEGTLKSNIHFTAARGRSSLFFKLQLN